MRSRFLASVASATLLALLAIAAPASAARSDVLFVHNCSTVSQLVGGLEARPEVDDVTEFNGSTGTPTAGQLAANGLVISMSNCVHSDPVTYGDRLADYVDGGGHVLQYAFDSYYYPGTSPEGRFASGGYAPLVNGQTYSGSNSLGSYDAGHPLMRDVDELNSNYALAPTLAAGAVLVASWSGGGERGGREGQCRLGRRMARR
jgi:hypothetical protein